MKNSLKSKVAIVASAASLLGVYDSSAILTWDLRATSATAGTVENSKTVTITGAGTVTFDLWAVVTGANGTADETLLSGIGMLISNATNPPNAATGALDAGVAGNNAILSTGTTLKGNFAVLAAKANLVTPWATAAVTNGGTTRDVNGDGALDIAGSSSSNTGSGYFVINAGSSQTTGPGGDFLALANGRSWRVAQYVFTIASATPGNSTGVNFAVPLFSSSLTNNSRASFQEDVNVGRNGAATNLAVAAPVILTAVPEPSAFGMVLIGALGLVGFRRMGLRRLNN